MLVSAFAGREHVLNAYEEAICEKYELLNEITEFRTSCGIRENMIQESTKPYRRSRFKLAWLIHS